MKRRAAQLLLLLAAGGAYAAFAALTGWALHCPFHSLTGLQCPGCGATRMCLALLRLDFHAAFSANAFLFVTLPFWAALLGRMALLYLTTGQTRLSDRWTPWLWFMLVCAVLWGVFRNFILFF